MPMPCCKQCDGSSRAASPQPKQLDRLLGFVGELEVDGRGHALLPAALLRGRGLLHATWDSHILPPRVRARGAHAPARLMR